MCRLLKNRNSSRLRSIAIAKESELLKIKSSIEHGTKLTSASDTSDIESIGKFHIRTYRQTPEYKSANDDDDNPTQSNDTDIESNISAKYQTHCLRTSTRAREIIAPEADTIKDFDNLTVKRRRRLEKY